jgi:MFS family permease
VHAAPTTESPEAPALQPTAPTPLWPIILVSLLLSIGTGILWNGLSFVAEAAFGYGRVETYTLSIVQGLFYVIAAGLAGRIIRALERHLAPRSVLALVLLAQGVVAPIILFSPSSPALWFVACAVSAASALQWPIIESYLTAGRSAKRMRSAIGWWNVVWMGSTLIALALTGVILDAGLPMIAIAAIAPVNLVAAVLLVAFGRAPGTHLHDDEEPVPASYRDHLAAARVLLPVSYVIVAALAPLMPFLTAPFGLTKTERTLVAATWLAGRLLSAAVLWQTQRWHGVWATLGAAGVLMAVGFAVAVLAPTLLLLIVGLALFGLGQGIIYYAAIYYAMRVGHADVDAAGTHEALIGLGYLIGPAIGFLSTLAASEDLVRNQIFVVAIWAVMGAAAIPAVRPWIRSRTRSRTQSGRAARDAEG